MERWDKRKRMFLLGQKMEIIEFKSLKMYDNDSIFNQI